MELTLLNLEAPAPKVMAADASISNVQAMEDLFLNFRTESGERVSPEKARRCSAVLACMRGISEDLAALPLTLYKRGENGDEPAVNHPLYDLLSSCPNEVMTSFEMREHIIVDAMLHGNFYVLHYEDQKGNIEKLWPLSAGYVTRQPLELIWYFSDPLTSVSGNFTADAVWRGQLLASNGVDGQALTLLAREAIGLLIAAEKQAARLFKHGVQTDLVLETTETLEEDDKTELRKAFMQRYAGAGNAFLPILLEGGLKANKIGLTAQESQYMEARQYQVSDVARIFRYPEVLLGGGGNKGKASTYASAEQFFQSYVKHCLLPWARRIEETIHRDLLNNLERKRYYARHDFDQLLRGDTAARYDAYNKAFLSGGMSPAEWRKKESLPYVPGLDYYVMPTNYVKVAGKDKGPGPDVPQDTTEPGLTARVARLIFEKERKAFTVGKADAEVFYAHFGSFVEDLTGADLDSVSAYIELRRTTVDRFSAESKDKAIAALISLCKGKK
jgi:HK97 family phage portal protein